MKEDLEMALIVLGLLLVMAAGMAGMIWFSVKYG